jgi:putative transposase
MSYSRRNLPHWVPENVPIFITWRLADGDAQWLSDSRVAGMMVELLDYGESERRLFDRYAWVLMPNHVHLIIRPHQPLADIMRWLKGRSGRKANAILGPTGQRFWQVEPFDHWVRCEEELEGLIMYVEGNPVKAGLVERAEDWPYSSACGLADDKRRSSTLLERRF